MSCRSVELCTRVCVWALCAFSYIPRGISVMVLVVRGSYNTNTQTHMLCMCRKQTNKTISLASRDRRMQIEFTSIWIVRVSTAVGPIINTDRTSVSKTSWQTGASKCKATILNKNQMRNNNKKEYFLLPFIPFGIKENEWEQFVDIEHGDCECPVSVGCKAQIKRILSNWDSFWIEKTRTVTHD